MQKILLIFILLACNTAHAAEMVNVEYIHKLIKQQWDITIPYSPKLSTPKVAANMKYLLTLIDIANRKLNGAPTTNYGNGKYATMVAADTVATLTASERLIRVVAPFKITTKPDTDTFSFDISAAGDFKIIWGDGKVDKISRTDTTPTTYSHTYRRPRAYTIGIDGQATGYSDNTTTAAVSFFENNNIAKISGNLGAIFSTLADGTQPRFYRTFYRAHLPAIPPELFKGIHGQPTTYMFFDTFTLNMGVPSIPEDLFSSIQGTPTEGLFRSTFSNMYAVKEIPEKLFSTIQGPPAKGMFQGTFTTDHAIKSIPANLFAGISGPPAENMFDSTFANFWGLESIPENLFADISGPPAAYMFHGTFTACHKVTAIPENLFGNISGDAKTNMFYQMFANCENITSPSARINGKYLYEIWPNATHGQVGRCYYNAPNLADYADIPDAWKDY